MNTRVGVISDTHGLLRPEAWQALLGCDRIVHAGDVGAPGILVRLREIAPVTAVRGNIDGGAWAAELPAAAVLTVGPASLYVLHALADLAPSAVCGQQVVISGHSHQASILEKEGVLYVNPGSAGPRRFKLPVTLAILEISDEGLVSPHLETLLA